MYLAKKVMNDIAWHRFGGNFFGFSVVLDLKILNLLFPLRVPRRPWNEIFYSLEESCDNTPHETEEYYSYLWRNFFLPGIRRRIPPTNSNLTSSFLPRRNHLVQWMPKCLNLAAKMSFSFGTCHPNYRFSNTEKFSYQTEKISQEEESFTITSNRRYYFIFMIVIILESHLKVTNSGEINKWTLWIGLLFTHPIIGCKVEEIRGLIF